MNPAGALLDMLDVALGRLLALVWNSGESFIIVLVLAFPLEKLAIGWLEVKAAAF